VARLVDKTIQQGCKKPQSVALISKKKAKIVEKPQFCHNESGHVNRLSVTESHKQQWKWQSCCFLSLYQLFYYKNRPIFR